MQIPIRFESAASKYYRQTSAEQLAFLPVKLIVAVYTRIIQRIVIAY